MIPFEAFASEVLQYSIERSVAFTIVFAVMAGAWYLLKGKLNSHVGSVWFLLPLVVLVVPAERWIPNPWNASNPIERAALSILPEQGERTFIDPATEGFLSFDRQPAAAPVTSPAAPGVPAPTSAPMPWSALVLLAWSLCMLGFLIRLALGQGRMQSLLQSAQPLDRDSLPEEMARALRRAGTRRPILLLESPEFDSPVLWTGRIPAELRGDNSSGKAAAIVLPEGLTTRLSALELRWVILHELAHLERGDHRTELLQRILGAAFLFHPLVWVSNRLSRSYREMACDDAALARCAESDRKRCARALFEVVAHAASLATLPAHQKHRTTHAMSSLFHSKKLTRRRIMRLIELDRPLARGLRLTALLPFVLVSGVALAAAHFPAVLQEQDVEEDSEFFEEIVEVDESPESDDVTKFNVQRATDWLLKTQGEDGGWHYTKPTEEENKSWAAALKPPVVDTPDLGSFKRYHSDVALTALSLQALVKRVEVQGSSPKLTKAIDQAVNYLLAQQDKATGRFGTDDFTVMVGQALATESLALAMRHRMTAEVLASLKASVKLLESAKNPYAAWRYDLVPAGDNDARITGYVTLALVRAFDSGAHAGPETFASAMNYLYSQEDKETGRTHYMHDRPFAFRLLSHQKSHPAERAEAPTAMHLRLRNESGLKTIPQGAKAKSIELLASQAPLWNLEKGTIDYTYWWQGTAALAGSEDAGKVWPAWRNSLRVALNEHQIVKGPMAGTWPTVDAWSGPGLEVYTTATCALALYASLEQ